MPLIFFPYNIPTLVLLHLYFHCTQYIASILPSSSTASPSSHGIFCCYCYPASLPPLCLFCVNLTSISSDVSTAVRDLHFLSYLHVCHWHPYQPQAFSAVFIRHLYPSPRISSLHPCFLSYIYSHRSAPIVSIIPHICCPPSPFPKSWPRFRVFFTEEVHRFRC